MGNKYILAITLIRFAESYEADKIPEAIEVTISRKSNQAYY